MIGEGPQKPVSFESTPAAPPLPFKEEDAPPTDKNLVVPEGRITTRLQVTRDKAFHVAITDIQGRGDFRKKHFTRGIQTKVGDHDIAINCSSLANRFNMSEKQLRAKLVPGSDIMQILKDQIPEAIQSKHYTLPKHDFETLKIQGTGESAGVTAAVFKAAIKTALDTDLSKGPQLITAGRNNEEAFLAEEDPKTGKLNLFLVPPLTGGGSQRQLVNLTDPTAPPRTFTMLRERVGDSPATLLLGKCDAASALQTHYSSNPPDGLDVGAVIRDLLDTPLGILHGPGQPADTPAVQDALAQEKPTDLLRGFEQALNGLDALHAVAFHGNIGPENIVVSGSGPKLSMKLIAPEGNQAADANRQDVRALGFTFAQMAGMPVSTQLRRDASVKPDPAFSSDLLDTLSTKFGGRQLFDIITNMVTNEDYTTANALHSLRAIRRVSTEKAAAKSGQVFDDIQQHPRASGVSISLPTSDSPRASITLNPPSDMPRPRQSTSSVLPTGQTPVQPSGTIDLTSRDITPWYTEAERVMKELKEAVIDARALVQYGTSESTRLPKLDSLLVTLGNVTPEMIRADSQTWTEHLKECRNLNHQVQTRKDDSGNDYYTDNERAKSKEILERAEELERQRLA